MGVARTMRADPSRVLTLRGHSDELGPPRRNDELSKLRAQNAAAWIRGRGVARERLHVVYVGSREPLDDAHTIEGCSRNRRVELIWE
jgi:outer membrane protein OmpA-like peptidoglycan-associated protein